MIKNRLNKMFHLLTIFCKKQKKLSFVMRLNILLKLCRSWDVEQTRKKIAMRAKDWSNNLASSRGDFSTENPRDLSKKMFHSTALDIQCARNYIRKHYFAEICLNLQSTLTRKEFRERNMSFLRWEKQIWWCSTFFSLANVKTLTYS